MTDPEKNSRTERREGKVAPHADAMTLFIVLALVGLGITMVYSASCIVALEKLGNQYYYLQRQALFALAGVFGMFAVMRIPYRIFYRLAYPGLVIGVALLMLLYVPGIGRSVNGATRWLQVGSVIFQPSEIAKLALIIFMSYSLCKKQEKIKTFSIGFLPHVLISLAVIFLIMKEPDFGTSILLLAIVMLMMFVAGAKVRYLFLTMLGSLPVFFWLITKAEYRWARILIYLNPAIDPQRTGFQITQSLISFGSGGLWGQGLGGGRQKLFFLPAQHTDFIYAVIGEELGLWGTVLVLGLFLVLVWRGMRIAWRTLDPFGSLLAAGITALLGIQALVNMGVTMGLLPTKGLPMPFVSYGGTSLVVCLVAAGILLNISSAAASEQQVSKAERA